MNPESSMTMNKRQTRRKKKRHQHQHSLPSFSSYLKKRDYEDQLGHQLAKIQSRLFTLTTTDTNNDNDFFDQALEEGDEATTQARRLIAKAHLEDF